MTEISLINKTRARINSRWLLAKISLVLKRLKIRGAVDLSVAVVGPAEIRRWNRIYRAKNQVTDVLSFDLRASNQAGLNGEILVCYAEAKIIARERQIDLKQAFLWLIIHGILHLVGYEHVNVSLSRAKKMFSIQDQLAVYFHV
jgi:probable rRNA maturation factor